MSNTKYKWSKLFAAKRFNSKNGVIKLDVNEQQELLDDIEKEYSISNCDHSNEVQRYGDGFVYTVCADCGKDLD